MQHTGDRKMKLLKCKISGTYYNSKKERIDYENIEGLIPFCDEDRAHQSCKNRYATIWLEKAIGSRPYRVREVFLDSCVETEGELSFIGKNIKEMDYKELQDLAVYYGLLLPRYKKEALRNMRVKAISEYMRVVKGIPLDKVQKVAELPLDKQPDFVAEELEVKEVVHKTETQSLNDELSEYGVSLVEEEEKKEYTLDNLKDLAKAKGIPFSPNIGYDKLYARVFD
jgi:hypothetical protein